ncbi:MAG: hypothetical protein PHQ54_00570, partial [Candidatus Omnitrophica bacterium]|nr:hypothetical protein [Candidatus Omnitrophota bacterium]
MLTIFISTVLRQCYAQYHSVDWALKELAGYYVDSSNIDYCGALIQGNENPDYFGENIVKSARKNGLYLNEFYLKDKERYLSRITEPFIVQLKGEYVIATSYPDRIEIKSPDSLSFLDKAEFLQLWDGSFFAVPINNMLLA